MDTAERLRPYVAGLAATWSATMPEVRHRGVEGSLAFVDISGFTTLTERLAAKGKVGAEEMSDLLNEAFATLLKVAYGYGASLVKWGGDAVLLLYEGSDHAAQASRASLEMQRTMRRIGRLRTSVGVVTLKMSVGISSGTFDFFLVGEGHRELLVAGPAATQTAVMEQIAEAGEVVVSAATVALLPPSSVGPAKESGWVLGAAPPADPRSRWWPRVDTDHVAACLDPALREHLLTEVGDSEHRQVAVGFVEVSGVDGLLEQQGPGASAGALHELMTVVQQACAHHRVTFWETDISKDGFKILLIAGAPKTSGHDEDAMLRAARSILDGYTGPVRLRVGVNTGRVFNGGFGPPFRRTWSVKGDAVNLAARVMGKAEIGQLVATEALLRRVVSRVDADLLPPFMVKGKRLPVHAAVVHRVSSDHAVETGRGGAFVGRRAEMDVLLDTARNAARGQGGGVLVTGDPGVGKSRLVDHVMNRVDENTTVLRGFGEDYESATAYYAVRRILRAVLGQADDVPGAAIAAELRRRVRSRCPAMEPLLPLLAVPFDVDLPHTPETAAVQEEFRRPRTMSLVVEFLSEMLSGPTVLLVDDLQVVDDLSAELLGRLVAEATRRPWLVLLVGREAPVALSGNEAIAGVVVPPLSSEDAHALVLDTPGGALLAPHVIRGVIGRAEGNPLFLHELTLAVAAADDDELPSSLEDLLAAQIDDLSPDARKLLRSVSVLGSRFDEPLAVELLDQEPTTDQWTALDHFLVRHADGSRRFRTRLARDAAYEGLPFRRRVALHDRAATALQNRVTEEDDQSEALSLHSLAAQRFPDAFHHACAAGRRARALYANADAATFFTRARIAARRAPDLPAVDVARALEELGDVHTRLAELPAAIDAYRAARAQAPDGSEVLRARSALGVALAAARGGFPRRALRWFSVAAKDLDVVTAGTRPDADELRARITVERALAHYRQGRYAEAAHLSKQALAQAEQVGAEFVIARALHMLEISEVAQGRPGDEPRVLRALALFENCGDFTRQAHMWLQLGVEAYYSGAWDRAVECYEHARLLYEQAGDDWNMAIASANVAELLVDQGRLVQAAPLVEDALRVWRVSGTPWDIGFGAALLGRLRARRGEPFEAMTLLGEAIESYSAGQEQFDLVNAELSVVEALLLQGAADAALQRLDSVERQLWAAWRAAARPDASAARGGGDLPADAPQTATVWRLRAYALGQAGDAETAGRLLEASLAAARSRGGTHEVALALEALVWLREDAPEAGERDELFAHLGIVWRPQIPRRAAVAEATLALVPRQRDAEPDVLTSGIPAQ